MRRGIERLLATLTLLSAASCAGRQADVTDCKDFAPSPSEYQMEFAGRAGAVTQQEHTFICRATIFSRSQLSFARLAQQQATNPAVMRFAEGTIDSQERMRRRLFEIAMQQDGVIPPHGLDAPHLAMRDQLAGLSGAAFDRAYLQTAARDGQAAAADFAQEATSGGEPTLNRFAADMLPLIEQRARLAQSMTGQ